MGGLLRATIAGMAQRMTNTMSEVLISILEMLGGAKAMPDADIPFIIELETQIAEKVRAPFSQQPPTPPAPATGGGGAGGGLAGLLGGMGPGMPGPPNTPPPDIGPMPAAPMAGMAGPGGGGRSLGSLGEVQRIMGAGPPRGARG